METVVAVCVPIANRPHPATFRSLMGLDLRPFSLLDVQGRPVTVARNDLVGRVLFGMPDVTHLLWVDDDMVFEANAARRLLAHDLPIVGGLCHGRRAPHYAPILLHKVNTGFGYAYQHEYPEGLVEVDGTGAAFLLVRREVFEAIEKQFPTPGEGPFSDRGNGEDVAFCERAKECGYKIFVDTTVKIGHMGEVVVDEEFARRNRFADFAPWFPPMDVSKGKPVATIVIPTYNQRPEWLRAAVASALQQTVPVEVIVVDDGSDDTTVWRVYQDLPGADRVKFIRLDKNTGNCWQPLNRGIKEMTTDYFCWLSSDDLFYQNKVEKQLRAMLSTGARASFHGYDMLTEGEGDGRPKIIIPMKWPTLEVQQRMLVSGCMINGLTVMLHKRVFEEVGVFDPSFRVSADWEFWNRIGKKMLWLPVCDVLATRRESGENASVKYQQDPEMKAIWLADDARIRELYAPRCGKCGAALETQRESLGAMMNMTTERKMP